MKKLNHIKGEPGQRVGHEACAANHLISAAVPEPKIKDGQKAAGGKSKDGGKATSMWPGWLATGVMPADYPKTTFVA